MLSVKQAEILIDKHMPKYAQETKNILNANGMILKENVYSDRDYPSFNKALMDGIAVNYASVKNGIKQFNIQGVQSAGIPQKTLKSDRNCFEIMTGAVVPKGCDTVIPVENITKVNKVTTINSFDVKPKQYIRMKGADHKKGDLLLIKGKQLVPTQIAIAASVGKNTVKVGKRLNIAVVSTGDELIDIHKPVKTYQTRKSNSHFIKILLDSVNLFETKIYHWKDNRAVLLKNIAQLLRNNDVLVFTGGLSMGKFDYIPGILKTLKVKTIFHKVKQKPGKPFLFAKSGKNKIIFGLPGNPVATQFLSYRYVLPYLIKALGCKNFGVEYALLNKNYNPKNSLTNFVPVNVSWNSQGINLASIIKSGGSGDFGALGQANGFIELPSRKGITPKGTKVRVYRWL